MQTQGTERQSDSNISPWLEGMCPHTDMFCGQQLALVSKLVTVKAQVSNNSINSHTSNVILGAYLLSNKNKSYSPTAKPCRVKSGDFLHCCKFFLVFIIVIS